MRISIQKGKKHAVFNILWKGSRFGSSKDLLWEVRQSRRNGDVWQLIKLVGNGVHDLVVDPRGCVSTSPGEPVDGHPFEDYNAVQNMYEWTV